VRLARVVVGSARATELVRLGLLDSVAVPVALTEVVGRDTTTPAFRQMPFNTVVDAVYRGAVLASCSLNYR
jgi:hypothetical protein